MQTSRPGRSPRAHAAAVAAVVVGLSGVLAACGSSPTASGHRSTTTTVPRTTTLPPQPTTGTAPCAAGTLAISASAGGAAAGTTSETFTLTNSGPSPCSLSGYPTVTFYGSSPAGGSGAGPKLDISTVNGGGPPTTVVLQPKQAAAFLIVYSDVPVNGIGCAAVASVRVVPPASTEALTLPVAFQPCGGSVTVDPVATPGSENA